VFSRGRHVLREGCGVSVRRGLQAKQLAPRFKQSGVFLVEPDKLDQVFDSEVGEGLDHAFSDAIDQMAPSTISISLATSRYPSGVGRRRVLILASEQMRVLFVDPDELHQGLDPKVGERHDAVFSDTVDPEAAILGVHFAGDIRQPVLVLAEVLSDAIDRGNAIDLVDVHGHAARAEIADVDGVQFQGSNSSSSPAGSRITSRRHSPISACRWRIAST
jgi:hypothetical protein